MFVRMLLSSLLLLASFTSFANMNANNTCPSLKEIKRTSGEYSWYSQAPGWTGHFAFPQHAKGNSTKVSGFIEARWIQLTNLENSYGYFECDYHGNYDGEVIRFVQAGTRADLKPTNINWYCNLNPHFPGPQCVCSVSTELCLLEAYDASAAPTPMYIDPAATDAADHARETYIDK
ncbi:MAG: DUF3757 domain-containing protein [Legionellales bacterium]|jgi:hypothetical protein